MLSKLKALMRDQPRGEPQADRRLATAVLLYEIAYADYEQQPAERAALRKAMADTFGIGDDTLESLLRSAEKVQRESISLHEFIDAINRDGTPADKVEIMRLLWRVAYADGVLDPQEEARMRKLADLLHVPHADYIRTKLEIAGDD